MSDTQAARTRSVTWRNPQEALGAARTLSGLEYLRALLRGELPPPPIAVLMGFTITQVREGHATFTVQPGEHHYNPIGMVHGGLAATLLDSAMGCAVQTLLPAGDGYSTMDLHTTFVRPISHDTGMLTCEAEVIHMGGRMATAQGKLVDGAGRLYAHGVTTCLVSRKPRERGHEG